MYTPLASLSNIVKVFDNISDEEREIGDILFFKRDSSMADVGLYIGGGEFIICTESQGINSVKTLKLTDKYWKENFLANG